MSARQEFRYVEELPDGVSVQVVVTDEGIIVDAINDMSEVVGTWAGTFGEIYDRLVR